MSQETSKSSLADLVRVWIDDKIKSNYDYSLASTRKQDIQNFLASNKSKLPKDINEKKVRDSFMPILDKKLGAINKMYDKKSKKLKFNPNINSQVTPVPQSGKSDESPSQAPAGAPPVQGGGGIVQPTIEAFDEASVSAVFSALFMTFRMAIPDIELLTEDEKQSLGKIWKSAFNIYFSNEKWAVIGIPALATVGIFMPKIIEGRRVGKLRKLGEQQKDTSVIEQESKTEKIEEAVKLETSPTVIPEPTPENKPSIGQASGEILPKRED